MTSHVGLTASQLPTVDEVTLQRSVEHFLYREAQLLDDREFEEWLALLAEDLRYRAAVRTWRRTDGRQDDQCMYWFDETKGSLQLRVRRMMTDVAWAEEPPSRTRRLVGNVRVEADVQGGLTVASNLLCFRNRGASADHDLIAAERSDRLVATDEGWRLVRRDIAFDQATMATKNLALLF